MNAWLDTETKALLQRSPPGKFAPPTTATFALVLLAVRGYDELRIRAALERVAGTSDARTILVHNPPTVLRRGLTHEDALLGQFELICCDCVSVFLADEVVAAGAADYLSDLYATLLKSPEFATVTVRLDRVPPGEKGRQFLTRFLGALSPELPMELDMMRKKARIMEHWATKIGGGLTVSPA